MRRSGLIALLFTPLLAVCASAADVLTRALPTQQPDAPPQRPVGEPDRPPSIGLDFFEAELDARGSHEEAWPWPAGPVDD